jgi:hypothetical protein
LELGEVADLVADLRQGATALASADGIPVQIQWTVLGVAAVGLERADVRAG